MAKRVCIGYRPKTGWPRDADGKLILVKEYGVIHEPPPPEPLRKRGLLI